MEIRKRRSDDERDAARERVRKAKQSLEKDGKAPGFDYAKAIVDLLNDGFKPAEIEQFCFVQKGTVSKWRKGETEPKHRNGEMLYIMYVETFNKKEEYVDWKRPKRKPTSDLKLTEWEPYKKDERSQKFPKVTR